jgi:hypothetical protein
MKRQALNQWLVLGVFGASFLTGCNHVVGRPEAAAPVPPAFGTAAQPRVVPVTACLTPVETAPQPPSALATPRQNPVPSIPIVIPRDSQAALARVGFEAPRATEARPALLPPAPADSLPPPAAEPKTTFPRAEPAPARKSYVDLTAAPCFSHAPDYNWIIGQVEYSRIAKEWRLRYASVDETDRYGGRVTLIENHHLTLLRDGQYVQVRGHLVNPDNAGDGPAYYRIESFRGLADPNATEPSTAAE